MPHAQAFRDGLTAARAGKKMVARIQFEQVTEISPDFAPGWLWLAWTADSPEQAESYLSQALELDPKNRLVAAYREITEALSDYSEDTDYSTFGCDASQASDSPANADDYAADAISDTANAETRTTENAPSNDTQEEDDESVEAEVEKEEAVELASSAKTSEKIADDAAAETLAEGEEALDELSDSDAEPQEETSDAATSSVSETNATTEADQSDSQAQEGTETTEEVHEEETPVASATSELPDDSTKTDIPVYGVRAAAQTDDVSTEAVSTEAVSTEVEVAEEEQIVAEVQQISDEVQTSIASEDTTGSAAVASEQTHVAVAETPIEEAPAEAVDAPATVLIVDDSPTVRKLVTMTLKSGGYAVKTAEDGVEAMKMLVNFLPDLILLDVNMPRMDGYKLCKLIKRHEKTKFIPVVMLSGKDGMFDKLRGTLVGCNDYISKPFESADLLKQVDHYVRVGVGQN